MLVRHLPLFFVVWLVPNFNTTAGVEMLPVVLLLLTDTQFTPLYRETDSKMAGNDVHAIELGAAGGSGDGCEAVVPRSSRPGGDGTVALVDHFTQTDKPLEDQPHINNNGSQSVCVKENFLKVAKDLLESLLCGLCLGWIWFVLDYLFK